tara:strand:- start:388 stop:528 length:141 start_codon:yes stop_codon:yes gene_type:complete
MTDKKKCECGKTKNSEGYCDGSHNDICEKDLDQNEDVPFADKYNKL